MGNIVLVILFFIFRVIIERLSQTQETQTPTNAKTLKKIKRHSPLVIKDERPKAITIKQLNAVKKEPDRTKTTVEEDRLSKINTQMYVKPEHRLQPEASGEIPELFTQEDILRGIILQEVLSPPKALMYKRR
ncbi:MAG: hypothetical protein GX892_12255 [Thermoanaerobacteraceae bacterium]|nr:hypothetical protein [Thermoanaerobacteraceae bacterium]